MRMVINFGIERNVNPLYMDTFTFEKNCQSNYTFH